MMKGQGKLQPFSQPVSKPSPLGPEYNPWFWNPSLVGIRLAPNPFLSELQREMGEDLSVTWNPMNERWQVWVKSPRVNFKLCRGWKLLFIHNGPNGEHLPLDARLKARLYWSSADAYGSAKKYFDRITSEAEREKEAKSKAGLADRVDQAMETFTYSQIKNIGKGSKFTTYHQ